MSLDHAHRSARWKGTACAIGAAGLFGVSAPLSKLLLPNIGSVALAGLLYLGAGLGLWAWQFLSRRMRPLHDKSREAPLRRADIPLLLASIVSGGIVGPILLLWGLARVSGITGSLMLNLETPLTVLIAVLFFRDHAGRRFLIAAGVMVTGAVVLQMDDARLGGQLLGAVSVAGAALCWALDNNFTQRLSALDPVAISRLKTLVSGTVNLVLALLLLRQELPGMGTTALCLLLGFCSYGVSLVLFVQALRILSAARTSAYFAVAPFAGAIASLPLLGERLGLNHALGALLMGCGAVLLFNERHDHAHAHAPLEHEHLHTHDEHHGHAHDTPGQPVGAHSHWHRHDPVTHEHAHTPDLHHRHTH